MAETQSIIVYRNPLEQQLWEGTLLGGNVFPIIIGMVVFFICFLAINRVIVDLFRRNNWLSRRVHARNWGAYTAIVISAVVAIGIASIMWI